MATANMLPAALDSLDFDDDEDDDDDDDNIDTLDIPWDAIDEVVNGSALLKWGRIGEPHFRHFAVSPDCRFLTWYSVKKASADSRVELSHCTLHEGQSTDMFKRQPRADLGDVSFSLICDDAQRRGVAIACKDRREYEAWIGALRYLLQGPPPAALLDAHRRAHKWAATTSPDGGNASHSSTARLRMSNISRDLKKRMKDTNDVFAFGRASWGQLGLGDEGTRLEPTLVPLLLGKAIRTVSCGLAHALVLADSGEVYAMGHGGSGRLGIGGSTEASLTPRLLLKPPGATGNAEREPYLFKAVSCGDMHSLACDAAGIAYSWGCGHRGATGLGSTEGPLFPTPIPWFVGVEGDSTSNSGMGGPGNAATAAALTGPPLLRVSQLQHATVAAALSQQLQQQQQQYNSSTSPSLDIGNAPGLAPSPSSSAFSSGTTPTPINICFRHPRITTVAAGGGYSAFVDDSHRLYTCGLGDGPLGHSRHLLATGLVAWESSGGQSQGRVPSRSTRSTASFSPHLAAALSPPMRRGVSSSSGASPSFDRRGGGGGDGGIADAATTFPGSGNALLGRDRAAIETNLRSYIGLAAINAASAAAAAAATAASGSTPYLYAMPSPNTAAAVAAAPLQLQPLFQDSSHSESSSGADGAAAAALTGGGTNFNLNSGGDLLLPVQVFLSSDDSSLPFSSETITSISCGEMHMGAATRSGHLYTWGFNGSGALGHGDTRNRSLPTRVRALPKDVISVACGAAYSLALVVSRTDGGGCVYAFGSTRCGQVPRLAAQNARNAGSGGSGVDASGSSVSARPSLDDVLLDIELAVSGGGMGGGGGEAENTQVEHHSGHSLSRSIGGKQHSSRVTTADTLPDAICVVPRLVVFPVAAVPAHAHSGSGASGGNSSSVAAAAAVAAAAVAATATTPWNHHSNSLTSATLSRKLQQHAQQGQGQGQRSSAAPGSDDSPAQHYRSRSSFDTSVFDPRSVAPPPPPDARPSPTVIAAGAFHSAVILDDGSLFVFGDGSGGQLGITSRTGLAECLKAVQRASMTPAFSFHGGGGGSGSSSTRNSSRPGFISGRLGGGANSRESAGAMSSGGALSSIGRFTTSLKNFNFGRAGTNSSSASSAASAATGGGPTSATTFSQKLNRMRSAGPGSADSATAAAPSSSSSGSSYAAAASSSSGGAGDGGPLLSRRARMASLVEVDGEASHEDAHTDVPSTSVMPAEAATTITARLNRHGEPRRTQSFSAGDTLPPPPPLCSSSSSSSSSSSTSLLLHSDDGAHSHSVDAAGVAGGRDFTSPQLPLFPSSHDGDAGPLFPSSHDGDAGPAAHTDVVSASASAGAAAVPVPVSNSVAALTRDKRGSIGPSIRATLDINTTPSSSSSSGSAPWPLPSSRPASLTRGPHNRSSSLADAMDVSNFSNDALSLDSSLSSRTYDGSNSSTVQLGDGHTEKILYSGPSSGGGDSGALGTAANINSSNDGPFSLTFSAADSPSNTGAPTPNGYYVDSFSPTSSLLGGRSPSGGIDYPSGDASRDRGLGSRSSSSRGDRVFESSPLDDTPTPYGRGGSPSGGGGIALTESSGGSAGDDLRPRSVSVGACYYNNYVATGGGGSSSSSAKPASARVRFTGSSDFIERDADDDAGALRTASPPSSAPSSSSSRYDSAKYLRGPRRNTHLSTSSLSRSDALGNTLPTESALLTAFGIDEEDEEEEGGGLDGEDGGGGAPDGADGEDFSLLGDADADIQGIVDSLLMDFDEQGDAAAAAAADKSSAALSSSAAVDVAAAAAAAAKPRHQAQQHSFGASRIGDGQQQQQQVSTSSSPTSATGGSGRGPARRATFAAGGSSSASAHTLSSSSSRHSIGQALARELDIRRPPSPTRVPEYNSQMVKRQQQQRLQQQQQQHPSETPAVASLTQPNGQIGDGDGGAAGDTGSIDNAIAASSSSQPGASSRGLSRRERITGQMKLHAQQQQQGQNDSAASSSSAQQQMHYNDPSETANGGNGSGSSDAALTSPPSGSQNQHQVMGGGVSNWERRRGAGSSGGGLIRRAMLASQAAMAFSWSSSSSSRKTVDERSLLQASSEETKGSGSGSSSWNGLRKGDSAISGAGGGSSSSAGMGATTSSSVGEEGQYPSTSTSNGVRMPNQQLPRAKSAFSRSDDSSTRGTEPLSSTVPYGPLPVVSLSHKEARYISCGCGFTIVTVATTWMSDKDAPTCMSCDATFAIGRRARHHCRNCGGIFCASCSRHRVPLLKLGHIVPVRVCGGCFLRVSHD